MSRTPNFMLNESHDICLPFSKEGKTLQSGTFVRPIELTYVPKHVTEDPKNKGFNSELEVFCYTRFGIVPIPRSKIIKL